MALAFDELSKLDLNFRQLGVAKAVLRASLRNGRSLARRGFGGASFARCLHGERERGERSCGKGPGERWITGKGTFRSENARPNGLGHAKLSLS